jgi:hypothetical protein
VPLPPRPAQGPRFHGKNEDAARRKADTRPPAPRLPAPLGWSLPRSRNQSRPDVFGGGRDGDEIRSFVAERYSTWGDGRAE